MLGGLLCDGVGEIHVSLTKRPVRTPAHPTPGINIHDNNESGHFSSKLF